MASSGTAKLLGKATLITGGSRGIGRAVATAYADAGASVFICARNQTDVNNAVSEIRNRGGEIGGVAGNVARAADVERIVNAALERYGKIDVLVNNASVLGPRQPIQDYPLAAWDEVIQVNLTGLFLVTRAVLPVMLARQCGSIINVTSGVGRVGKANWGAYAASKGGLESLTQVLADEVKSEGIRVNAVNPAATRTQMRAEAYPAEDPMTLPTPETVVAIFLHLAADESGDITGRSLNARDWRGKSFD